MERKLVCKADYEEELLRTREQRMQWWKEARFGMFIHYGIYSSLMTHEWSMAYGNYTFDEYVKNAEGIKFDVSAPGKWVKLAKEAGMKYIVLTTRHHEGFSLWDSDVNLYNASVMGPECDIIKLFVEACRKEDMRIGFYFSLMDWVHPDSYQAAYDREANQRFTKYLKDMLHELMTRYGKIDILWYDIPRPMVSHEGWDSLGMNQMVRSLQPDIIINDRSLLEEDFSTPEEKIAAGQKEWEACMTFNGISWGCINSDLSAPYSYNAHQIIRMLCKATADGGNLLLNIGPGADGSVSDETIQTLKQAGAWLKGNSEAVYGKKIPTKVYRTNGLCSATEYGNYVYIWNWIWPENGRLRLGGFMSRLRSVRELSTSREIEFVQDNRCIILQNLPEHPMEKQLGITVFVLEFDGEVKYTRAYNYPQLHQGRQIYYENK